MIITALTYRPIAVSSLFTVHSSQAEIYTFASKERDEESGLSYFGSRYYSSDLSIWLSVDPMSDKYPSLSPYVYCANNPVKLVDPNGEEIVGTDNKAVSYSYDNQGNVVWSNNASDDTKRIGNAMLQTKTGKGQLDFLIGTKTKVSMKISSEDKGDVMGKMVPKGKGIIQENTRSINLKAAEIVIYEGSIRRYLNPDNKKTDNVLSDNRLMAHLTRMANPTLDEYIGAVACHEIEHLKPDNIYLNHIKSSEVEKSPEQMKANYILEIFNQKQK